ncbi:MAG: Gfo/Idh/MocA family oxidoreductase [Planctomycetes bacterium]|nr:Gfo/Idh/MocA family oxidoreductase [Planctomycetota bacterium]
MKVHGVGIIGFGFIGKVHAYGYTNLPLFYDPVPLAARVTHVVTGHQETAEKGRAVIGADVATTDYRTVTENPEIDIVHICSPNHLHKDALLSAMRHGKHIYCDKPLVATVEEAEEIRAALADYRGTAQMTFQYRFYPATLRAKQLIDEGALGEILTFRSSFLHGGSADPVAPLKWKLSRAAGGGVIADLASHVLDLVDHTIGPFDSLMADTRIVYPRRPSLADPTEKLPVDTEDSVVALARLQSGATGTIEATKIATGSEDELRLEIHGTRGALRFNGMDPHHLQWHDAQASDRPLGGLRGWNRIATGQRYDDPASGFPSAKSAMGWIRTHVACLANFLEAVAAGRPAVPGLEQGIRVQGLMECLRRSAAEKAWVDV